MVFGHFDVLLRRINMLGELVLLPYMLALWLFYV